MERKILIALVFIASFFGVVKFFSSSIAEGRTLFGGQTPIALPFQVTTSPTGIPGSGATTTQLAGSLIPQVNKLYNLGTPVQSWLNVYASGTGWFTAIDVGSGGCIGCNSNTNITWVNATGTNTTSTNLSLSGIVTPSTNNSVDLGKETLAWRSLYSSSTEYNGGVSSTGGLYPTANNAYDLGGMGNLAWKNVYSSGTISGNYLELNNNNVGGNPITIDNMAVGSAASPILVNTALGQGTFTFGNIGKIGSFLSTWTSDNAYDFSSVNRGMAFIANNNSYDTDPAFTYLAVADANRPIMQVYGSDNQFYDLLNVLPAYTSSSHQSVFSVGANGHVTIGAGENPTSTVQLLSVSGSVSTTGIIYDNAGVSSTGGLYPTKNNAFDLGASNLSWGNLYASGTLAIPSAVFTGVTSTGLIWTNATGTNTTSTNLNVNNLSFAGATGTSLFVNGGQFLLSRNSTTGTVAQTTTTQNVLIGQVTMGVGQTQVDVLDNLFYKATCQVNPYAISNPGTNISFYSTTTGLDGQFSIISEAAIAFATHIGFRLDCGQ